MTQKDLNVTEDDLLEAKEIAASYSLDDARKVSVVSCPIFGILTNGS